MQAERFDTLTRLVGSRTSRRLAVALAATGLLSLAVPEAAAARCSKQNQCPDCKKCRKHRCKPDATQDGNGCSGGKCDGGKCIATLTCTPACDTGQRCAGGTCVCDDESCNGCCDGTTCKGGGADGACGSGGEDCRECASFETCQDGTCETHNRAVSVSFELFDEWLTSCYLTVHVTGFVPGTYTGFADFGIQMDWEFSIEVGAEGTGMWTSRPYRIWSQDGNVTVTVDGVSSVDAPVTC